MSDPKYAIILPKTKECPEGYKLESVTDNYKICVEKEEESED